MLASSRTAVLLVALLSVASHVLAIQYNDVQMLCLVNKERKRAGARPLGLNAKLTKAAYAHSKDQARTRKMSHTGSDGSSPSKRVSRAGYNWKSTAENVAYGYKSMQEVMKTWMKSPGHKKNILSKENTHFGSGYAMAGSTAYFTQEFASGEKVDPASIPKCDGSDSAYGGAGNGDQYGEDMSGEEDAGGDYGGEDAGDSYGGGSKGGKRSKNDYSGGEDSGDDSGDYGSSKKGGKRSRGGRRGGRGGNQDSESDSYGSSKQGRGGRQGGRRGGRRGGNQDSYGSSKQGRGGRQGGRGGRQGGRGGRGGSQDY